MTGNELKAARKQAGLTQIELAERWGINRVTLQLWERRGDEETPQPKIVKILVEKDLKNA